MKTPKRINKYTLPIFIERATAIHGEKYDYSLISPDDIKNMQSHVLIKCQTCFHEWSPTITSHINMKSGCPECSKVIPWNAERFVKKAQEIHGDKYDYCCVVDNNITSNRSHVIIICKRCKHEWAPTIGHHITNKQGCPSCAGKLGWTLERFLKRAEEIHGEKYDYSLVTKEHINSAMSKVPIICRKCSHKWDCSINSHINIKTGCPKCKNKNCQHNLCNKTASFNLPGKTMGLYCSIHKEEGMINVRCKTCKHEGCNKRPTFNLSTEKSALYCFEHKREDMINVQDMKCLYKGCNKKPIFNIPTEKTGLYCFSHKRDDMINIKDKKCLYEGCNIIPNFNIPTEKKGLYCFSHKKDDMINVKDKKCLYEGCNISPKFNLPTKTVGLFCMKHKKEHMINVKEKRCLQEGCNKQPSFNISTEKKGLYCFSHKKDDMINVKDKKCLQKNCNNISCFNLPTETKGLYCSIHKKDHMIDVRNKKCLYENCNKRPIYNLPTEIGGLFCMEHKKQGMTNVANKKCLYEGCNTQPIFNLPTKTRAKYCSSHKTEGMINIYHKKCRHEGCNKIPIFNVATEIRGAYCFEHKQLNMLDVKHKKCLHEKCSKRPNYNLSTELVGVYCVDHKHQDMININYKNCQQKACKSLAIYGYQNKRVQYCNIHKLSGMINLHLATKCDIIECQNEHEFIINNEKFCLLHCPDKTYEIALKRKCKYHDNAETNFICKICEGIKNKKEWMVVRYISKNIDTKFVHDSSQMLQGCSKKRPDIYFDLLKHCVIVEVDENQHDSYDPMCERARICEIVGGIGGRSVIIIRFNPDKIIHNKKKIEIPIADRLDKLVKVIKKELIKDYDEFVVLLIQLYYDDNHDPYSEIKTENITNLVAI